MNCIRDFFTENKIFFEIFSYIVIGVAGIIFSYFQLKINKQQIEIQKKELQPIFKITYTLYKGERTETYDTEIIEIHNDGKAVKSFDSKIKTFYKIEYSNHKKGLKIEQNIPIAGFYFAQSKAQNSTGLLLQGYYRNNNADYARLYRECIAQTLDGDYYFINRFSLIKIVYVDISDTKYTVYYKNNEMIDEKEYNQILESENFSHEFPLDVEKVTLNEIKRILKLK